MIIDKETATLLKESAKFGSNGLLISLDDLNKQLIDAVDSEFISLLHDEMVDRRDMDNIANPNEWFDKSCCYSIKKWESSAKDYINEHPIFQKNEVYKKIAKYTIKYWDLNVENDSQSSLEDFERLIQENRNEYFENEEYDVYGFRPSFDFYTQLLCGEFEIIAGDREIICRTVKKNNELIFYRDEKDKEVTFKVDEAKGKKIEWIENGECEYEAELDPLYKSMYSVYVKHPEGITDASLATNENLFVLYRKIIVGETNKEKIDPKNVKDYISRLNKELFYNGIPKEYRISKEGNLRFIPYLKYKFKQ